MHTDYDDDDDDDDEREPKVIVAFWHKFVLCMYENAGLSLALRMYSKIRILL